MPSTKKSEGEKKPPTAWVAHVKAKWAEMQRENPATTYKMAMCAASQCWDHKKKEQYPKKPCGTGKKGTKCAKRLPRQYKLSHPELSGSESGSGSA